MATHSSVLARRIPGTGSLVGFHLRGRTESETAKVTWQQQQQAYKEKCKCNWKSTKELENRLRK